MSYRSRKWIGIAAVSAVAVAAGGFGLVSAATDDGNVQNSVEPCRLTDTRSASTVGPRSTPLGAAETMTIAVTGNNGECTAIAADARAVQIQLTSVGATADSFLTAYPADGATLPEISQLNPRAAIATISNTTVVTLSAAGEFKLYNHAGMTEIVIDILGVFTPDDPGPAGPTGPQGPEGPVGPTGSATFTNPEWGVNLENTLESGTAILRGGPTNLFGSPPYGIGSLQLLVGDSDSIITFSNDTDFLGDAVADLTAVGFHVYTTAENNDRGGVNMPNIKFAINPNGAGGTTTTFSTLLWFPATETLGSVWSGYQDAVTTGKWGLTGAQFNSGGAAAECGFTGALCTFDEMQTFLVSGGGTGATILNAQVAKGRDNAWQGAIDGLRINDVIYDFEPFGVNEIPVGP